MRRSCWCAWRDPSCWTSAPDWGGGKLHATTAALEPLSEHESSSLIDNLLGTDALDTAVRARILTAAEGNPLFVEETIAMLVDEGALRSEDGRWIAAHDLDEVAVPPTIQALLDARLDRLDEAERAALGRASVVGQVFYVGAVAALSPENERDGAMARMQQLVRRDLIRPDRSDVIGQEAFRFRHGTIRDAAYAMLPKEVRADLHELLADGSRVCPIWSTPTSSWGITWNGRTRSGSSSVRRMLGPRPSGSERRHTCPPPRRTQPLEPTSAPPRTSSVVPQPCGVLTPSTAPGI